MRLPSFFFWKKKIYTLFELHNKRMQEYKNKFPVFPINVEE